MNISLIHDCYGCGLCAVVCGRKIIDLKLNGNGFYEPTITDTERCADCGLCVEVCSFSQEKLAVENKPMASYGAWSNNHQVRRKCSSGGVGFELGRYLIGEGYKVCGVRYNAEKGIAEHYIATTVEELVQSAGSKYIQSYTVEGLKAIDRKRKYLVTGAPCQIDSFRRYIRKFRCEDNFVLMDFFCHGVPSMLAWQKYCKWAETKVGKITYASWRNKFTGWHDSWAMSINGEENCGDKVDWHDSYNLLIRWKKGFLNSRLSQGDMFYKLFLSDACLGKACYEHCKFKYDHSSADIRIGDAWGKHYANNEDGVSAAIAFTQKGNECLKACNITLEEVPFGVVAEGQMKTMPERDKMHRIVMKMLRDNRHTIEDIRNKMIHIAKRDRQMARFKHPRRTIKNIVKRFLGKKK